MADGSVERPAGPVAPERFARAPGAARVPAGRLRRGREARSRPTELVERFRIPHEQLEEHLSLLNLVNFGGGCYAVYAELHGDEVHVDKELYGDTFRAAPRLTPLEARAIRLALEFVGPMIAAEAHTPLDRVRRSSRRRSASSSSRRRRSRTARRRGGASSARSATVSASAGSSSSST